MIPIGSILQKTLLLLTITTLTISLGTSLSWDNVNDDDHINTSYELTVTGDAQSNDVLLWYRIDDGWTEGGTFEGSGPYTLIPENSDLSSEGSVEDLEIKANTTADSEDTGSRTITLDDENPSIDVTKGSDYIGSDEELILEVSDPYSDVETVSAVAGDTDVLDETDDVNCDADETCEVTFDLDTDNVDQGNTISIDLGAVDQAENIGTNSVSPTFDGSYDGDESPDVSLEDYEGSVARVNPGDDVGVDIDIDEADEDTDIRAICKIGGDEFETTGFENPDDEDTEFTCDIPVGDDDDEYTGSVDFEVELCDEASNCVESDSHEFVLDLLAPVVEGVEHSESLSTFNSNFELKYNTYDPDGSDISRIEYFFSEDVEEGSGTSVELDDSEFTVDPSGQDSGSQTVYIRAEDEAGRWSNAESFDFEYYPSRSPKASLSVPESLEVESGSTGNFTLTFENTGEFHITGAQITSSSDSVGSVTIADLEQGSSVQRTVSVNTSDMDIGVHNLTLSSDISDSVTIELTVTATESQRQDISNQLQDWVSREETLNENISEISTLDAENENVTRFSQMVENARNAVDNGKYYQAQSYLSEIESAYEDASATYSEGLEQHEKKMRQRTYMFAFAGFLILAVMSISGVIYWKDDVELGLMPYTLKDRLENEEFEMPDLPDSVPELGVVEKVKELTGEEEEEEDEVGYSFEDFT